MNDWSVNKWLAVAAIVVAILAIAGIGPGFLLLAIGLILLALAVLV